jgi:hypothetical protein
MRRPGARPTGDSSSPLQSRMPITAGRSAVISFCGRYRYFLTRQVGPGDRTATFIMLNPSTADGVTDDPTIRRCIGFARRWHCGRLVVVNLFAIRTTDPAEVRKADDPEGPANHAWLKRAVERAVAPDHPTEGGPVVCAWGTNGCYLEQDLTVLGWLERVCRPMALEITRGGHPKHPLYASYAARLVPYAGRTARV